MKRRGNGESRQDAVLAVEEMREDRLVQRNQRMGKAHSTSTLKGKMTMADKPLDLALRTLVSCEMPKQK